jgi:hypothetical protein
MAGCPDAKAAAMAPRMSPDRFARAPKQLKAWAILLKSCGLKDTGPRDPSPAYSIQPRHTATSFHAQRLGRWAAPTYGCSPTGISVGASRSLTARGHRSSSTCIRGRSIPDNRACMSGGSGGAVPTTSGGGRWQGSYGACCKIFASCQSATC